MRINFHLSFFVSREISFFLFCVKQRFKWLSSVEEKNCDVLFPSYHVIQFYWSDCHCNKFAKHFPFFTHRLQFSIEISLLVWIFHSVWYHNLNAFVSVQNHIKLRKRREIKGKESFLYFSWAPFFHSSTFFPSAQSFWPLSSFWNMMTLFFFFSLSFFRGKFLHFLFAKQNLFIFYKVFFSFLVHFQQKEIVLGSPAFLVGIQFRLHGDVSWGERVFVLWVEYIVPSRISRYFYEMAEALFNNALGTLK